MTNNFENATPEEGEKVSRQIVDALKSYSKGLTGK
jgi:hypothetical protein